MFSRKIVCVRCGLTMKARDYERRHRTVVRFDPATDCSHLFFDKRDKVGIALGLSHVHDPDDGLSVIEDFLP